MMWNDIDDIDFIEPMRLKMTDVLYQDRDGLVMIEKSSRAVMASMKCEERFRELFVKWHLDCYDMFVVKQKSLVNLLVNEYYKTYQFPCYQASYHQKESIELVMPDDVHIRLLDQSYAPIVHAFYHQVDDLAYIESRIERQQLWGLFEKEHLAGFIGMHNEGSMGLLEIIPSYRRRGYGYLLEGYLINELYHQGKIPFCQVVVGNEASLALQKKLKMDISSRFSYWLFDE